MTKAINKNDKKNFITTIDKSKATRNFKHYLAVWLWIGWTAFYFFLPLILIILYVTSKMLLTILIGLIVLSAIYPIKRSLQPKLGFKLGDFINLYASEYFHVKMLIEKDNDTKESDKLTIFAMEPHDVLPLSIFAFNDILKGLPGYKCFGCITSICFSIPLMKHAYTWVNAVSVDKKTILNMIKQRISPVICPGGVQEVTYLKNDKEVVLYLKKRLGFIKLGLQNGVSITPVFTFGLRQSFSFWIPKNALTTFIGRKLGVLPMLFFGVWGVPLGPGKPSDYNIVVGKPIKVPLIAEPTEDQIKEYHQIYLDELTRLFELFKEDFGMKDVPLRIV